MLQTDPFEYVELSQEQGDQITSNRLAFKTLHESLKILPESREKSLAITKLEEAAMWANKAVALFRGPQEG